MKGVAIVPLGLEDAAREELEGLGASEAEVLKGAVLFQVKDCEELAKIAYVSQSADRVLFHLAHFSFADIRKDVEKPIGKVENFGDFAFEGMSFRASCERRGEHGFSSPDVEKLLGDALHRLMKRGYGVDAAVKMASPDVTFFASIVDDSFALGIDFTGFDAGKRDYKIFLTPVSVRGTISYGLLRYAGYRKKHTLLDPFVNDGAIVIEAALYASGKPVQFYRKDKLAFARLAPFREKGVSSLFESIDKKIKKEKLPISGFDAAFQYVDYGRKNAKIAGVEKVVYLSRVESEWLDIKFREKSVDRIVTKIPEPSRKLVSKDVQKLYGELFYQAEYILKDGGKVGVLCRDLAVLEPHYAKYGFVIERQKDVWTGEQRLCMAVLVKGKKA